eukprot:TRINITY_DN30750_c0_g1_i1.p1 TRINITY_DN30750_c0_g1~~TRINITY_DN30750_c0_g1_i1.p1  ORF type:complete len:835 (+),score=93.19 TRINITY_DN30750_c0_g1_i1:53-2506(+)
MAMQNTAMVLVFCGPLVDISTAEKYPDSFSNKAGWAALIAMLATGQSFGQALKQSWSILCGVVCSIVISAAHQYVLCQPRLESPDFSCDVSGGSFFSLLCGFIFTFLILITNLLGPRGQLLCLHLNTGNTYVYAAGLANRSTVSFWRSVEVLLASTGWGLVIALVAILFPRPYLARWKAWRDVLYSCTKVSTACAYAQNVFMKCTGLHSEKLLFAAMSDLDASLASLKGQLGVLWWEGFDVGSLGRSSHLMSKMNALLSRSRDVLRILVLTVDMPSSGPRKGTVDEALRIASEEVLDAYRPLMFCLAHVSISGFLSDADKEELCKARQRIEEARAKLLPAVLQSRTGTWCEAGLQADQELYLWSITQLATIGIDAATEVVAIPETRSFFALSIPKPTITLKWMRSNRTRLQVAFWNTISISIGFCFDFWGIHRRTVKPSPTNCLAVHAVSGAGTAQNVGWLNNKYVGLSIKKTLHRLCGIVVPFILGAIVEDQYGDCSASQLAVRFVCFALVDLFAKYFNLTSGEYGYFALLTGAFLPLSMLRSCVTTVTPPHVLTVQLGVHNSLISIVEAVTLLTLIGGLLFLLDEVDGSYNVGSSSASADFVAGVRGASEHLVNAAQGLFAATHDEEVAVVADSSVDSEKALASMSDVIAGLKALNRAAEEEPRFGGLGWPDDLGIATIEVFAKLEVCMRSLSLMNTGGLQIYQHRPGPTFLRTLTEFSQFVCAVWQRYNIREMHNTISGAKLLEMVDRVQGGIEDCLDQERVNIKAMDKTFLEVRSETTDTMLHDSVACTHVVQQHVLRMVALMQKLMGALPIR